MEPATDAHDQRADRVADPVRGVLARQRQPAERDREHEHDDADDRRGHHAVPTAAGGHEEHERDHRERELREDVPDPGHHHVAGDGGVGESPRAVEAVAHAHRERTARGHRVRHRRRRLAHHRGLGEREPGHHGHEHEPVREQAADRDRAQRRQLHHAHRADVRPDRRQVGDLREHAEEQRADHHRAEHAAHHEPPTTALLGRQHPCSDNPETLCARTTSRLRRTCFGG